MNRGRPGPVRARPILWTLPVPVRVTERGGSSLFRNAGVSPASGGGARCGPEARVTGNGHPHPNRKNHSLIADLRSAVPGSKASWLAAISRQPAFVSIRVDSWTQFVSSSPFVLFVVSSFASAMKTPEHLPLSPAPIEGQSCSSHPRNGLLVGRRYHT